MENKDLSYLELNLPKSLQEAIQGFVIGLEKLRTDKEYCRFDADEDLLRSEINCCEVDDIISKTQANYLRKKYLEFDDNEIV